MEAVSNEVLTAVWHTDSDPSSDSPAEIYWADGRQATIEDYRDHQVDTHVILDERPNRYVVHMFPSLVGDVLFKKDLGSWALCHGDKMLPLDVADPNAAYDILIAEVYTHPVVFRVRIIRE